MKTIQYWGAGNVHEGAITGNSRLWYTGMSCPVTDAEATALIAYSASFRLDQVDDAKKDNLVTAETNPLTGGIVSLVVDSAAPSDADGRPDGTIYVQTV